MGKRCSYRLFCVVFILGCVLGRPILADEEAVAEQKAPDAEQKEEQAAPAADSSTVKIERVFVPADCIRKVEKKDFVRYHYYGMLEDGTYFDSSHSRGHSYDTYVFNGWLIPGMDQGLLGMCVNEHRVITIPPELAYGERGSGSIPPNATIKFNTILLDVWNENDNIVVTTTKEAENCERRVEVSDYVRYHYNGTLLSGAKFHSSYQDGSTYNTYVGKGWLIKGMDKGLVGACVGERRRIVIPPFMAYGEKGDGKNIPASATTVFDVEIVDVHNPDDTFEVTITHEVPDCKRKLVDGDFIRYHYNGSFVDGTVFDTSYQRNTTYNTYVGMRRLIPGVDGGLLGVCVGERRRIVVPPHLGYGEPGVEGVIPPSAVLIFDVHVIDFHNPKDDVEIEVLTSVDDDEGARVSAVGDYVTYDFELHLLDGTLIDQGGNDTTWGTYIGRRQVPEGFERGLTGLKVGEKRRVTIPPHIAYGEFGRKDYVPGSAVVVFTLTCTGIHDGVPRGKIAVWKTLKDAKDLPDLFKTSDTNGDAKLDTAEYGAFIESSAASAGLVLAPHRPAEGVIAELVELMGPEPMDEAEFIRVIRASGGIKEEIKEEL